MPGTTDSLIEVISQRVVNAKIIQPGEHLVIMGGMPMASQTRTNFVKLHQVTGKKER